MKTREEREKKLLQVIENLPDAPSAALDFEENFALLRYESFLRHPELFN